MQRISWIGCAAVLAIAVVGCGKDASTKAKQNESAKAEEAADPPDPAGVVEVFLQALREGNDETAENLLTRKAREETAKHDLAVQPPGTPNATYKVGSVEFPPNQKSAAWVNSQWTERWDDGSQESYDIIWALRHEKDGWKIAGMATKLTPEDQPLFLNFEDPEEMLRKWEQAEQELARRQENDSRGQTTGDGLR